MNDIISKVLLEFSECKAGLISENVWKEISKELTYKSKLTLLKEVFSGNTTVSGDDYFLIKNEPFDLLFFSENECQPRYDGFAYKVVLTDSNFRLLIKQELIKRIVSNFESTNFNSVCYQQVIHEVLNAF